MKEFIWPVRVYYEDTDSGGVVYYANYLRFMERARTEWLRGLGFEQDRMIEEDNVIFAVRHAEADFLSPARFNDALVVTAVLSEQRRVSLTFRQEIRRETDNQVLCRGEVKVACLDAKRLRPAPLPESLIQAINHAE